MKLPQSEINFSFTTWRRSRRPPVQESGMGSDAPARPVTNKEQRFSVHAHCTALKPACVMLMYINSSFHPPSTACNGHLDDTHMNYMAGDELHSPQAALGVRTERIQSTHQNL